MEQLTLIVFGTLAILVWLTCVVKGFFHNRFKKLELILVLSIIYGSLPSLLALFIVSVFLRQ